MTNLEQLRALARGKVHGGYRWAMICDDGDLICESCVRTEYRQIYQASRDSGTANGWRCVGIMNSGESETTESCANCNAVIWEHGQ